MIMQLARNLGFGFGDNDEQGQWEMKNEKYFCGWEMGLWL
jgi:hypothetical protein